MKAKWKGFIPGFITALLLVGLVGGAVAATTQKQALLNYSGIGITLDEKATFATDTNGKYVEPFAIDGTIYLPVRGISNLLGMGVNWNAKDNRVELTSPKTTIGPFYDKTIIPRFDFAIGEKSIFYQNTDLKGDSSGIQCYSYYLSLSENGDFDALKKLYDDMLSKVGYKQTLSGDTDSGPFYLYTNSKEKYEVTIGPSNTGSSYADVTVFVRPTGTSSSSSGSSSSSSSPSGNTPAPPETTPPKETLDMTIPHHIIYGGDIPSICPVCQINIPVVRSLSTGEVVVQCRNPQCMDYNVPTYVMPKK